MLTQRAALYLKSLARRGDMFAQGVSEAGGPGLEVTEHFYNAEAADADWLVTAGSDDAAFTLAHTTTGTYPRNVTATFGSAWAGGNPVVTGTDQFGAPITETLTAQTGLVAGVKIFKTITSITHPTTGAGSTDHEATFGFGTKLGLHAKLANALVQCISRATDNVGYLQQTVTVDLTYNALTMTNAPDAARDYQVMYRI